MPEPIQIASTQTMRLSPEEIGAEILKLENWKNFHGYGPLPGIKEARFRIKTPEVVGTQIEVLNRDGSRHVEEITSWLTSGEIVMRMSEFSAPLSRLASHFIERWTFTRLEGGSCRVCRSFELYPKAWLGVLMLRLIGPLMQRAAAQHLREMAGS